MKEFLRGGFGFSASKVRFLMKGFDSTLTVFMFHDVDDTPGEFTKTNDIWVSTQRFREQIEFVAENFNVISMPTLLSGDIPVRAAMVTFDDGFAGTFKNGIPALNKLQLPSTVFLNMSPVYNETYWAEKVFYLCEREPSFIQFLEGHGISGTEHPELDCTPDLLEQYEREHGSEYQIGLQEYISPYVSSQDLMEAEQDPLLTLGSHLYAHYNVRTLSDGVLAEQYRKNFEALSSFKSVLPVFAFPFGHPGSCFSMEQARSLLAMGATRLFTSWPQPNYSPDSLVLDRVAMLQKHDRRSQLWFQVLRRPILRMVGRLGTQWDYPQEIPEDWPIAPRPLE